MIGKTNGGKPFRNGKAVNEVCCAMLLIDRASADGAHCTLLHLSWGLASINGCGVGELSNDRHKRVKDFFEILSRGESELLLIKAIDKYAEAKATRISQIGKAVKIASKKNTNR